MKRIPIILFALLFMTLTGCGTSEKAQEKAAERAIEKAIGSDVKVDIDGEKYKYEDKDGNKIEIGGTEWPSDKAAEFIPKFNKGTITGCTVMSNIYIIDIEKIEKEDYDSYLKAIENKGFTDTPITTNSENYYQYQAGDADKNYMMIVYEAENKKMQIMGTAAVKE